MINHNKEARMSHYWLTDTEEGELLSKQLLISIQEWSTKFKYLATLPFLSSPENSVESFKKIAKSNDTVRRVRVLLEETKKVLTLATETPDPTMTQPQDSSTDPTLTQPQDSSTAV